MDAHGNGTLRFPRLIRRSGRCDSLRPFGLAQRSVQSVRFADGVERDSARRATGGFGSPVRPFGLAQRPRQSGGDRCDSLMGSSAIQSGGDQCDRCILLTGLRALQSMVGSSQPPHVCRVDCESRKTEKIVVHTFHVSQDNAPAEISSRLAGACPFEIFGKSQLAGRCRGRKASFLVFFFDGQFLFCRIYRIFSTEGR